MCISPPSAWIASSLTGRCAASISSGKAAISTGVALRGAQHRSDRSRLLEQHDVGACRPDSASVVRPASLARSSCSERFDVLRNWKSALSPCGSSGARGRTGSPPGGSILSTSAPRSAAILAASDVARRRQSGTFASFTSTIVKRASGRAVASIICGMIAQAGAAVNAARMLPSHVTEDFMAQTGNHKGLTFGIFLAPFHRVGENPTLCDGARHGADRVDRRAGLRRGLDRRASFRRLGDHRLAGSLHRRRHRAHALHPPRLGRDQPALSPPADGGEPLRAARPHVARPHDAGLRSRRAAVRRLHDGHRALDPAAAHGRGARGHHGAARSARSRSR